MSSINENKKVKIKGCVLGNIECLDEQKVSSREEPKYGKILFLVHTVDNNILTFESTSKRFKESRLIIELSYIIKYHAVLANKWQTDRNFEFEIDKEAFYLSKNVQARVLQKKNIESFRVKTWLEKVENVKESHHNVRQGIKYIKAVDAWEYLVPEVKIQRPLTSMKFSDIREKVQGKDREIGFKVPKLVNKNNEKKVRA